MCRNSRAPWAAIVALLAPVGCTPPQSVDDSTPGGSEPVVYINNDVTSRHVAQVVRANGAMMDLWVERDRGDGVARLSDIRVTDGDDVLHVRFDAQGRPVYVGDDSNTSVFVHSYHEDEIDVTISLADGRSARGLLPIASLGGDEASRGGERTRLSERRQTRNADSTEEAIAALCSIGDFAVGVYCDLSTIHSLVKVMFTLQGCAASFALDLATFPTFLETYLGCAASPVITTFAQEVIDEILCEGVRELLRSCATAHARHLDEDEPPVVPTTGEPDGEPTIIRISQQTDGIATSSAPDAVFSIERSLTGGEPARICVRSVRSSFGDGEPIDPAVTRCYLFTVHDDGSTDEFSVGECNAGSPESDPESATCMQLGSGGGEIHFVVTVDDLSTSVLLGSPYEVAIDVVSERGEVLHVFDDVEFRYQPANIAE